MVHRGVLERAPYRTVVPVGLLAAPVLLLAFAPPVAVATAMTVVAGALLGWSAP